jgi:UDP-glucuronate decarboxylase
VDDLLDAMETMMASDDSVTGPINVGNPREITVRYLAETVIRLTGSRSTLEYRPLPVDDPHRRCPDITLAGNVLGWHPTTELEDGLNRTIAYFDSVLKAMDVRA